jgi:hypothetical protein
MVEGWRLFVTVKSLIYLTWQSPLLISEISPELEYHLHIGNFSQFVPLARAPEKSQTLFFHLF